MILTTTVVALSLLAPLGHGGDRDYGDRERGRNSRGDCENAHYCDERDGVHADKIIICIEPDSCSFDEQASLVLLEA